MPRRVTVVTTWFPSEERPAEAPFVLEHVRAIAREADVTVVHVRLLGAGRPASERYAGVPVIRAGLSPRHPLRALATLRGIGRVARRADVVHSMAFTSLFLVALARPWSGRRAWVHTEHWSGVLRPETVSGPWVRLAWLRRALRLPDWRTSPSSVLTEKIGEFAPRERTSTVPLVIESPLPVPAERPAEAIRLVAVGGLVPGKDPLLTVETVALLRRQGHAATMTWVGDGPLRAAVEARVQELGLSDAFTLAGSVRPHEVYEHLVGASAFFLPTVSETFGAAMAEALAMGLPVVAARVGGFVDFVDASNGVLVPSGERTAERFASAIVEAQERFRDVSPAAIAEPIRARFSAETVGREFAEVYERVLAAR